MTLDKAYILLNTYANQLSKLGDAKEAIKNKQKLFIQIYSKVKENFEYIKNNATENEEVLNAAIDVLVCTSLDNQSLASLLEKMPEANIENIEKVIIQKSSFDALSDMEDSLDIPFTINYGYEPFEKDYDKRL